MKANASASRPTSSASSLREGSLASLIRDHASIRKKGFIARVANANGFTGVTVITGVEGIGEVETYVQEASNESVAIVCHHCCGLVEKPPPVTREEQISVCERMVDSIRRASP